MSRRKKKNRQEPKPKSAFQELLKALPIWAFAALLFVLGLAGIYSSASGIWYGHASQTWPITEGQITFTDVDWSDSDTYSPVVKYSYQVDSKDYSSGRILFGAHSGFEKDAEVLAERYSEPMVNVYYKPENPEFSVLEPGVDWYHNGPPILGCSMVLILALGCFYGGWRLFGTS